MDRKKPTYDILELAAKWQNGTITAEEKAFYEKWYASFDDGELQLSQRAAEYEALPGRIYSAVERRISADGVIKVKQGNIRLWPRIAVAAASAAAIVFGVWFFSSTYEMNVEPGTEVARVNDIAPGKNGATITLGSGKVIELSDAKSGVIVGKDLKYDDGTKIAGSALSQATSLPEGERVKAQTLMAETKRGQTYQFTLPDETKVWLNADSKISFPSQFSGTERKILLSGEGYFEVAKDKAHPFIVATDKQSVEVLGTHFNINSYADEGNVKTTLLEGSVRVKVVGTPAGAEVAAARSAHSRNDGARGVVLKPNQQAVLSGSEQIAVKEVSVEEAVAWRNGEFLFRRDDMRFVMRQVARWYDVEVVYLDDMSGKTIWGSVNKYSNISAVLDMIELTGGLSFRVEGRKVFVSRSKK